MYNKLERDIDSKYNTKEETQGEKEEERRATHFIKLVKAEGKAHHNDSKGTIVSPSVACWI